MAQDYKNRVRAMVQQFAEQSPEGELKILLRMVGSTTDPMGALFVKRVLAQLPCQGSLEKRRELVRQIAGELVEEMRSPQPRLQKGA